jgi:rRNA maturation endonuclease Nob1
MKYTLILLPLLASTASAQEDVWKLLKKGDRVQVTFRSGNMISGQIDAKPGDPRIKGPELDFSQASEITIDVSLEYPGLNGTMTVPKKEIKEIRLLQNLDPITRKRLEDEVKKIKAQAASDEAARKVSDEERNKAAAAAAAAAAKRDSAQKSASQKGEDLVKEAEDLKKGLDLLARFPPDKWGPQTMKEIADKTIRNQRVTGDEREFVDPEVQRLWQKAVQYSATQKGPDGGSKEKATEEKKQ